MEIDNLIVDIEDILLKLRLGEGINLDQFDKFLIELKSILEHYQYSDSLPKKLAYIMSLTLPSMMCTEGLYHGEELTKLTNSVIQLQDILFEFFG